MVVARGTRRSLKESDLATVTKMMEMVELRRAQLDQAKSTAINGLFGTKWNVIAKKDGRKVLENMVELVGLELLRHPDNT